MPMKDMEMPCAYFGAAGVFGSVAYIQRINTLGGRIPGNFYSIPAFQTQKNYALAIPFQVR